MSVEFRLLLRGNRPGTKLSAEKGRAAPAEKLRDAVYRRRDLWRSGFVWGFQIQRSRTSRIGRSNAPQRNRLTRASSDHRNRSGEASQYSSPTHRRPCNSRVLGFVFDGASVSAIRQSQNRPCPVASPTIPENKICQRLLLSHLGLCARKPLDRLIRWACRKPKPNTRPTPLRVSSAISQNSRHQSTLTTYVKQPREHRGQPKPKMPKLTALRIRIEDKNRG